MDWTVSQHGAVSRVPTALPIRDESSNEPLLHPRVGVVVHVLILPPGGAVVEVLLLSRQTSLSPEAMAGRVVKLLLHAWVDVIIRVLILLLGVQTVEELHPVNVLT